ncbi:Hypothetical protein PHPALM_5795 [Phytophthora palmivora]|uniref:Uncharacterized protein n=1 Tax=Phytophthora palmivora TaxID=4796 RepID=A0A2P4YGI4_9STRA|nr:Hypothetical protein PHPALM_5795 [Phytophthora palmivora]
MLDHSVEYQSPRSDKLVVYGLYIPLIRFAPRELEEQILYRRQQPGVTYPTATDNVVSKLFTIENVSFYTDLNASPYWSASTDTSSSPATTDHPIATALLTSDQEISKRQFTHEDALKDYAPNLSKPAEAEQNRLRWKPADFMVFWETKPWDKNSNESGGPIKPVLLAADIATEEIEFNIDFDQIAMILEELESVVDYFKRARTWKWRPSCIDREQHAPPSVKVLPTAILPLTNDEEAASIVFSIDKQRKTRQWFRAMWRYAFRCFFNQQQRARK